MLSKREKKKKRKKEKERRKNNIINNQNCILITVSLTQIDHRQAQLPYIIFNYINFFFFFTPLLRIKKHSCHTTAVRTKSTVI